MAPRKRTTKYLGTQRGEAGRWGRQDDTDRRPTAGFRERKTQLDYLLYVDEPLRCHLRAETDAAVDNRNQRQGNLEGEDGRRLRRVMKEATETV